MKTGIHLTAGKHSVLLISPQPWDSIQVSKHNYAKALAKLGNTVYFLNPPQQKLSLPWVKVSASDFKNIQVVDYSLGFPYWLKFKAPWLFDKLMRRIAPKISFKCGNPEFVWDFDNVAQFSNLNAFPAKIRIFHPVDHFGIETVSDKSADVTFSVGQKILDSVLGDSPKYFIQHGLTDAYIQLAEKELANTTSEKPHIIRQPIRVGYIGDLRSRTLDRITFQKIVERHSLLRFELFGPYQFTESPVTDENLKWQEFLESTPNCVLHGRCTPEQIADASDAVDVWLVCYDVERDINSCCNSHKILEYLATGKAVVGNRITSYDDLDLLYCPADMDNRGLLEIFNNTISTLQVANSLAVRRKRIEYALDNSYEKHVKRIEKILNSILEKRLDSVAKVVVA